MSTNSSQTPSGLSQSNQNNTPSASNLAQATQNFSQALNSEFIYYSSVLRMYVPVLSTERDKVSAGLWVKKLLGPEYNTNTLKPKRNRYLLSLVINLYNDECLGIFDTDPPSGVLPEIEDLPPTREFSREKPCWLMDTQWEDTVMDSTGACDDCKCELLPDEEEPVNEVNEEDMPLLDAEFKFLLWVSRPYVAMMAKLEDKTKAAAWIQKLCSIAPEESDPEELKKRRNDYLKALLGYIYDLRITGPFRQLPPAGDLPSLELAAERTKQEYPLNDPTSETAEDFLCKQMTYFPTEELFISAASFMKKPISHV